MWAVAAIENNTEQSATSEWVTSTRDQAQQIDDNDASTAGQQIHIFHLMKHAPWSPY